MLERLAGRLRKALQVARGCPAAAHHRGRCQGRSLSRAAKRARVGHVDAGQQIEPSRSPTSMSSIRAAPRRTRSSSASRQDCRQTRRAMRGITTRCRNHWRRRQRPHSASISNTARADSATSGADPIVLANGTFLNAGLTAETTLIPSFGYDEDGELRVRRRSQEIRPGAQAAHARSRRQGVPTAERAVARLRLDRVPRAILHCAPTSCR